MRKANTNAKIEAQASGLQLLGYWGSLVGPRGIGARRIARGISRRVRELGFEYGRLYVLELSLDQAAARCDDYGYRVETVSEVDGLITLIERREAWFREAAARGLAGGDVCFVAKLDGKVISCLFATFDSYDVLVVPNVEYSLPLDSKTVGAIDGYTLPEHRGKHAYSAVFNACIRYCAGAESERLLVAIAHDNVHSLKAHHRLGLSRIVLLLTTVRFLGMTKHSVKPIDMHIEGVL